MASREDQGVPILNLMSDLFRLTGVSGNFARVVVEEALSRARVAAVVNGSIKNRGCLSRSLDQVARFEAARGDHALALSRYEEILQISRSIADEVGIPIFFGT